ncbi:MAG: VanZ family protein [Pirellulaceae bacterium]|jgi:VanZ family protein|nr:VanZ family protein [Pirellulaceae bacterium]MDP7015721.1 VanZ family protein [Pirellulaceae bacterium]
MPADSTNSPRRRTLVVAALVVYWAALFVGTHTPSSRIPVAPSVNDKVLHFAAYAGLAFLLSWAMGPQRFRPFLAVLAITAVYGIADELLQMAIPSRRADWQDWIADALGALGGVTAFIVVRRWWIARHPSQPPS